ncbi:MAG: excinuclease ABC subunit UvrC [Bacteriovoracia bacterium]
MSSAYEQRLIVLQDKARNTTEGPGVYRMLDKDSKILYIGKAKSLQHRVSSYFRPNIDEPKTRALVQKVHSFDVILTQTEAEALILESILIKKHKPRYNIMLKDDKSYPYVMVDEGHTFPKVLYVRRPKKKKNVSLYGPFASSYSLRSAVRTLNRIFRLRDCSDSEFANRSRPCINYQIGICSAPCTAQITPENYRKDVERALQVLKGYSKEAIQQLSDEMEKYSALEEFEQAARVRDQITSLQDTISRRKDGSTVERGHREGVNRDVVGWYRKPDAASIALLFVRGGNLVDSATFHFDDLEGRSDEEILSQFLAQFYLTADRLDPEEEESKAPTGAFAFPGAEGKSWPEELLLPFDFPDLDVLVQSFQELNHKITVTLPQKGAKHEMLLLGEKNAENAFDERQREKGSIYRVLADLKAKLRLENYPRRIECYDISNLGDTGIVASRVTFIEGKPDKSLYRHYKIRSTNTQNDFAAMREVIERRLVKTLDDAKNFEEPPDLLIVDGGKGQLSMAVEVIKELNVTGIDLVALAKAKAVDMDEMLAERRAQKAAEAAARAAGDNPTAEGIEAVQNMPGTGAEMPEVADPAAEEILEQRASLKLDNRELIRGFERIFKPGRMNPIVLAPDSPVTHLLQRVRDEAHRFAVNFQRQQRKNF